MNDIEDCYNEIKDDLNVGVSSYSLICPLTLHFCLIRHHIDDSGCEQSANYFTLCARENLIVFFTATCSESSCMPSPAQSRFSSTTAHRITVLLSGTAMVEHGSRFVRTTADLTSELFRGDAIIIDKTVFRVSTATGSVSASAPEELDPNRKNRPFGK